MARTEHVEALEQLGYPAARVEQAIAAAEAAGDAAAGLEVLLPGVAQLFAARRVLDDVVLEATD